MNEFKLLPWQEKVVCGSQRSLAVPAGARTGKNIATVHAMQNRITLAVVPSETQVIHLQREAMHYGCHKESAVWTWGIFCMYLFGGDLALNKYEQVIINEIHGTDLISILRLRDYFKGRLVVMGVPTGLPCPIFYPLSKMTEWEFLEVNLYETPFSEKHKELRRKLLGEHPGLIKEIDGTWQDKGVRSCV